MHGKMAPLSLGNLMSSSALGGSKKGGTEASGCGVKWFAPEIVSTYASNRSMVFSPSLQKNPYFGVGQCPNTWRKLLLLTRSHHISILMEFLQTKEHGSLLKTFYHSPEVVRAHLEVVFW